MAVLEGPTYATTLAEAPATGDPLNVTRSERACDDPEDPTACSPFYSPRWGVHPVALTSPAIEAGDRRLTDHEEIIDLVLAGAIDAALAHYLMDRRTKQRIADELPGVRRGTVDGLGAARAGGDADQASRCSVYDHLEPGPTVG